MPTTVTSSEKVETVTPVLDPMQNSDSSNKVTTPETASLSKDLIHTVSNLPSVTPDWTNRKKVIFMTLYFSGGVVALITFTICIGLLLGYFKVSRSPIDQGLVNLGETLIYCITFLASSVIGAFCFGVAFEVGAYRKNITSLASVVATSGNPPSMDK